MDKQKVVYTYNDYSAFQRNEILIDATTWMNLEDIMQREISQTQNDKCYMTPILRILEQSNAETESRTVITRGWGEKQMENYYLMGREFQ